MTSIIASENWDHDLFYFVTRPSDDDLLQRVKLGDVSCVLEYLEDGGGADKVYEHGTLLHYAVAYKHVVIVSVLLEAGASPNITDSRDISSLQLAVCVDDLEIVKKLLEAGANMNFRSSSNLLDQSILHEAAARGSYEVVKVLLDYGADVNAIDCSGSGALYRAILRMKEDPSSCDEVENILELLLSRGADIVNVGLGGSYYLVKALAQCGTLRALQLFLDNGINLRDFQNEPLLIHAFENDHEEVLDFLLETNIFNVDQKDTDGRTLLQYVIASSKELMDISSLVKKLLHRGANVNILDDQGFATVMSVSNMSS